MSGASGRISFALGSALFLVACGDDGSGTGTATDGATGDTGTGTGGNCEPSLMAGAWTDQVIDFQDPFPPGNDVTDDACGWGGLAAHHCFITAVHAVHLHTGKLLLYHGRDDERVLSLDLDPEDPGGVVWMPLVFQVDPPLNPSPYPDLFCSGHAQLGDGSILITGGNVTGGGAGGGLADVFRFLPPTYTAAEASAPGFELACPKGWDLDPGGGDTPWVNDHPPMMHDRWYPTLSVLGTGQVLVTGGTTRAVPDGNGDATNSRLVELYDPVENTVTQLPEFPGGAGGIGEVPLYPFMFVLPSGDVLFAGGESTSDVNNAQGLVLVAPENTESGEWTWSPHLLASQITGASAVMYAPGKILKTGGRAQGQQGDLSLRTNLAEKLDLSAVPGGVDSYEGLSFEPAAPMSQARHFQNMVLLPNGKVLVLGGNSASNSRSGDHWQNPCDISGQPVLEKDCAAPQGASSGGADDLGCPSACVAYQPFPEHLLCDDQQSAEPENRCAFLRAIACCDGHASEQSCIGVGGCSWTPDPDDPDTGTCGEGSGPERCGEAMEGASCVTRRCRKTCETDADCPNIVPVGGECLTEAPEFEGKCSPANNECFATRTAEMWDPECDTWVELGAQQHARIYHSTALLLPNGNVISMGGGHRDFASFSSITDHPESEIFDPQYAENEGDRPTVTLVEGNTETYLQWFDPSDALGRGSVAVQTTGAVERFTLIRLAATTHGFDQDQRFTELEAEPVGDANDGLWTVYAPAEAPGVRVRSVLPPGYYMLFALTADGNPSPGQYIRVGDESTADYGGQ